MPHPDRDAPILVVEGLSARYREELILSDVSFSVRPGEVLVIVGGSGCGKSTLLKHCIGLLEPAAGRVLIEGTDLHRASEGARRRLLRRFGVMYQNGALFGSMTLLENVRLPLEEFTALPSDAIDLIACLKLRLVGLDGFGARMPSELSGGMQKRAAIARALALEPDLVFLDEPSAGLDPVTGAELDQLIVHLSRKLGATFVVVSHELESIFTIADRVIMLDRQARGIIAEGPPRTLAHHSEDRRVRRFFAPRS